MSDYTETIVESEDRRARIVLDEYADEPFCDHEAPIFRVLMNPWSARVENTGYGTDVSDVEGALAELVRRHGWSDGIDVFTRWVRAFHDGTVSSWSSPYDSTVYVSALTRQHYTGEWGNPAAEPVPDPDMSEWIAYMEGDVWGVVVEERVLTHTTITDAATGALLDDEDSEGWREVESCWGFYGRDNAEQQAAEMFWEVAA